MRDEDHERNKDTLARMVSAHGGWNCTQELIEAGVVFHLFVWLACCQILYLIDLYYVPAGRVKRFRQGGSLILHSYHQPFILPSKHVTEMSSSHKTCRDLLLLSWMKYTPLNFCQAVRVLANSTVVARTAIQYIRSQDTRIHMATVSP